MSNRAGTTTPLVLNLERTIGAKRQRVWDAWTRPEQLRRWSSPEGLEVVDGELELKVGGRWRVTMQERDGGRKYVAVGIYREVTPPERLVYTHSWETDDEPVETVVTVEFREEGDATRIVFMQEGFASAGSRDGHAEGWTSTIDRLARLLEDRPR
jgi:uncharacterized protein YndB with AHSA1/START domain